MSTETKSGDDEHDGPECQVCYHQHDWGAMGYKIGRGDFIEACPNCGLRYATPPADREEFEQVAHGYRDLPGHEFDDEELHRRLPALRLIDDDAIREETMRVTNQAPAYFWLAPASQSDYHHPVCRENYGLWAHTLMVSTALERLLPSWTGMGRLTDRDADLARAAVLLHDQRKSGLDGSVRESSTSDHDLEMAAYVREQSRLPEELADAIAAHMGAWYDGPKPATPLEDVVHTADMVASTADITCAVPGPLPEELAEIGVTEAETL
jgi:hypothetical protein